MELVKVYNREITESKKIVTIDGLDNSDIIKGFSGVKGFKAQKTFGIKGLSSVKHIKEELERLEAKANKKGISRLSLCCVCTDEYTYNDRGICNSCSL